MEINESKYLNFGGKRKLPIILQSEISECGLACVLMIASILDIALIWLVLEENSIYQTKD